MTFAWWLETLVLVTLDMQQSLKSTNIRIFLSRRKFEDQSMHKFRNINWNEHTKNLLQRKSDYNMLCIAQVKLASWPSSVYLFCFTSAPYISARNPALSLRIYSHQEFLLADCQQPPNSPGLLNQLLGSQNIILRTKPFSS